MKACTLGFIIVVLALLQACSRHDEQVADSASQRLREYRAPMRTLPWLADFKLGTAPGKQGVVTDLTDEFSPGEPICLSMKVNHAPSGTIVTTYWYSPSNSTLGYETKAVSADKKRLRFVQDNTVDWQQGVYRAEVWIGDTKLKERHFEIVAS